jgi:hypothetical protein
MMLIDTLISSRPPGARGRWPLSQSLALGALLGVLGACGPTAPAEQAPASTPRADALPFDVKDVIQRAQARMPTAQLLSAPVVSPETPVSPQPSHFPEAAVAAGNGVYFVVWSGSYQSPPTILGMRVRASDGALLDPAPIDLSGGLVSFHPSVAFDGNNFLVVWEWSGPRSIRVYGSRVRASDGARLDPAGGFFITTSNTPGLLSQSYPSVAFDGTKYLVVSWGGFLQSNGSTTLAVTGTWLQTNGQLVQQEALAIASANERVVPRVTHSAGRFLVVWGQNNDIVGVRIDAASRTPLDAGPRPLAATVDAERDPAVAPNGSEFLLVWRGAGDQLKGTRVRGSDGAVLDSPSLSVGGPAIGAAAVTFDGSDYRVAWQGTSGGVRSLFSTRVSAAGTVAAGAELLLSQVHASTSSHPPASIAAAQPGHFLVAYPQHDTAYGRDSLVMRRVEDTQSEGPCEEQEPTLVLNGGATLTLECAAGSTYSDLGAQAWDGCGNPIQVHAYNAGGSSSGPGPNAGLEGSYTVSYAAWDSNGRTVTATRTVNTDDRTAPTLSLLGPTQSVHTCGSMWVDPGWEATDACYGNLGHTVWRSGEVNGWGEGTYTVTYTVTDGGGNSAPPRTRTVEVVDCPW